MYSSSVLVLKPFRNGGPRFHRFPQHELTADVHHGFADLYAQPDGDDGHQRPADTDAGRDRGQPAVQRLGLGQRHGGRAWRCRRARDPTTGQDLRRNTGTIRPEHQ